MKSWLSSSCSTQTALRLNLRLQLFRKFSNLWSLIRCFLWAYGLKSRSSFERYSVRLIIPLCRFGFFRVAVKLPSFPFWSFGWVDLIDLSSESVCSLESSRSNWACWSSRFRFSCRAFRYLKKRSSNCVIKPLFAVCLCEYAIAESIYQNNTKISRVQMKSMPEWMNDKSL